ncbi:MAG: ABC transporter permease [Cyclobacteriaceae bacterium]|nr:ABC transporter permease [Cyclobacteriaceae bacterium]
MFRSFIRIAIRNFGKQLSFSLINVVGLAISLACSLVILMFVSRELSYEKHFSGHERIYRIATHFMTMGEFANGPQILLEEMANEYPWVDQTTRVKYDEGSLGIGDFTLKENGLLVEQNFFEVFQYPFYQGEGDLGSDGIVLTRSLANTIFGNDQPLGKVIEMTTDKGKSLYSVRGVVDTDDINSHLNTSFWAVMPQTTTIDPNWFSVDAYNYVKVKSGVGIGEVQAAVDNMIETKVFPQMQSTLSFEEWFARDDAFRLIAQPLDDIYLKGTLMFDISKGGNETMVYVLLAIAGLILFIASINFINLSTARAINRAKEVGVKKVVGSSIALLRLQFISEALMVTLASLVVAMGLAELVLILVERVTGLELLVSVFSRPQHLVLAFFLAIALGIVSGLYPALVLSSFKPIQVLKSSFKAGTNSRFRNVLVVFQFGLSTILVITTLIMIRQIQFMSSRDLGFSQDNVLIIGNAGDLEGRLSGFMDKMRSQSGVVSLSQVNRLPGSVTSFSMANVQSAYLDEPVRISRFQGDFDYPSTLGFQLVEGRFFDKEIASDSNAIILNESAANQLLLEHPVGEIINKKYEVVGVVRDFNFESLRTAIAPSMISVSTNGLSLALRIESNQARAVIDAIEQEWASLSPKEPINYYFLDQNFKNLMHNEQVLMQVLGLFTGLALFIACLGLYGLSAYLSVQRSKEIGIRKVMGATSLSVLTLLNKEYAKLLFFSFIIAIPVAIYLIKFWLAGFAYKTSIEWWIVAGTCVIILFISWTTVGYHSLRASQINPAETLRRE